MAVGNENCQGGASDRLTPCGVRIANISMRLRRLNPVGLDEAHRMRASRPARTKLSAHWNE